LQASLGAELSQRLRRTYQVAAKINLHLGNWRRVADMAIFTDLRPDMLHDVEWVTTVPLATVEILTRYQSLDMLLENNRLYLSAGAKSCWLVLPTLKTIYVFTGPATYRAFANEGTVRDEGLGVKIPLVDIFS